MLQKVNLKEKFNQFTDHWNPRIAGEINDVYIKLTKLKGEFFWHTHADEDEMFLVVHGQLRIRLRDGEVLLNEGELLVIPRGVEHQPIADEEVQVLLIEPKTTLNTGNVVNERTVHELKQI